MKRIELLRRNRKLSQASLAEESGVPQPIISHIENGRYIPSEKELQSIAKVLEAPNPSTLTEEVSV